MKALSRDTHPHVEHIQIELLRSATGQHRFALARSLSETTMCLARQAIRRAHPEANDEDVALIFVEVHYGRDMAERLRADLIRRKQP